MAAPNSSPLRRHPSAVEGRRRKRLMRCVHRHSRRRRRRRAGLRRAASHLRACQGRRAPLPGCSHHGLFFARPRPPPPATGFRTNSSVSTGPQHSSPFCNLMRYGLPSSQSLSTVPACHSSQFASTASPTEKRRGPTLHSMTPRWRASRSKFRPMNTRRHSRTSSSRHRNLSSKLPLKSMCTPWKMNFLACPLTASTPLYRKRSFDVSSINSLSHIFNCWWFNSPSKRTLVELTLASCWCSPSVFKNSGSIFKTLSNEKARMLMSLDGSTCPYCVRMISASALMPLMARCTSSRAASSTRSLLFSSTRSAKASCSTHSFSTPSGFSSRKCSMTCFASTTVMMPSRL
mmetsp:Transcript_72292/g.200381  ORF Transcript_72292/g.200381 Transcript_72292/m.200381 type:complete len:346 (-) Transcript_72292:376-1413(-)